ncbi:hypothetical protein [Sphingobium lactosutens]|uniref:Uncharacterized protein n=1 Tax=Sphingobium lactosutens DS20 TaxID=1331060 RepID=T0HJE7_9SPHN|nr:hypothetical protein [Sphingobium lactosutens]EQB16456.1 hypothetical protein RLDS_08215 [Sphingobium lactosutens DS20]
MTGCRTLSGLTIASLMLAMPIAAAQVSVIDGEPARAAGEVEQISDKGAHAGPVLPPEDIVTWREEGADMLADPVRTENRRQSVQAVGQLTPVQDGEPVTQLYRGGPTAQPSAPLSSPAQGRTGAVEAVDGQDRCDPGAADRESPTRCAQVIETRSAEFAKPSPTALSPEQKLLVDGRIRNEPVAPDRRIAARSDVDDPDYQQIAAAALQGAPASVAEKPADEEKDPQAQALQNAAIGAVVDVLTPR